MKKTLGVGLLAAGLSFGVAHAAFADDAATADAPVVVKKHLGTDLQKQRSTLWNQAHGIVPAQNWSVLRPFSEIENTGFVAISAADDFELPQLREAIAKNLPDGVTLIIYLSDASQIPTLQQEYGQYLGGDRLKFVTVPDGGDPDWGRDSLPYPVYLQPAAGSATPTFGLVASIYPQEFDPNAAMDQALGLPMVNTNQMFRGGNLLLDLKGNCFAENANEVADLSDPQGFFTQYFGCATVTLLDKEGGIGDIDERIKFLDGNKVLTDNQTYADLLTSKGYEVHMIPTTGNDGETYMNTLLVNGTIFVPQMGIAADADAVNAYKALGFNAIGVYTKTLADDGDGNIHCVTMNYPPGAFVQSATNSALMEFAVGQK